MSAFAQLYSIVFAESGKAEKVLVILMAFELEHVREASG